MTLWPTPSTALSATASSTLLDAPSTASAEVPLARHALHGWAANRGQTGSPKQSRARPYSPSTPLWCGRSADDGVVGGGDNGTGCCCCGVVVGSDRPTSLAAPDGA